MTFALIILFCLLGSVVAVGFAGLTLLLKEGVLKRLTVHAVNYATGTLFGAAFLGMIPNALNSMSGGRVLSAVLTGIVLFFLLEKLMVWRHCHRGECGIHSNAGTLILLGDSIHNFVDGAAIDAAFSSSVSLGIAASVAVFAHEVPQEVGDFAILLESGYSRARAFAYNAVSSTCAILGAVLTYFFLVSLQNAVPYLMSLSAASFLYIALADLVPNRRGEANLRGFVYQFGCLFLGIGTISVLHMQRQWCAWRAMP
jgi:zinc and cadmium transporter